MTITTLLGRLRLTGFFEGLSYLILLGIAMPLKYYFGFPIVVRIVGMAHGILFILFIALSVQATIVFKWSMKTMFYLFIASIVPFGTFYADYKLLRYEAQRLEK